MALSMNIKLLLFVFQIIGIYCSNSKRVIERIKHLENRFNTESNFRDEDYADIIDRLDEIDKKLNTSLQLSVGFVDVFKMPSKVISENVDKLRDDVTRIRTAFHQEKSLAVRFRREIPRIENDLTSLQEDLKYFCTANLNKTEKIVSLVEKIDEPINEELDIHFNELKRELLALRTTINHLSWTQGEEIKAVTAQIEKTILKTVEHLFAEERDRIMEINKEVKEMRAIVENNEKLSIKGKSCNELRVMVKVQSGVYTLQNGLDVFCDQTTDGGGWTVFQRRMNGEVDFYRNWTEYKGGFGDLNGEFWLGNKYLSILTASGDHELRIDMEDFDGNRVFAEYSKFKIFLEEDSYRLEVSGYSGNSGDSLGYHNGMPFTTFDNDNDKRSSNCASDYHGAWWYKSCYYSNLNGKYFNERNKIDYTEINWNNKTGYCLKFVEMKFRSLYPF